jgi:hypothetical protein
MFYSKSTNGFYTTEIHGANIPKDAVEITNEQNDALLNAQANGQIIQSDRNNNPIAVDPPKATAEQIWELIKEERDRRMNNGGYKVGTKWFHSNTFSRTQQIGLLLLGANIPANTQWKTMDGTFISLTQALVAQIYAAAVASDIAIFNAAETHKAALMLSAEPSKYDFSGGWPATFV